jgi:hypothetical protein
VSIDERVRDVVDKNVVDLHDGHAECDVSGGGGGGDRADGERVVVVVAVVTVVMLAEGGPGGGNARARTHGEFVPARVAEGAIKCGDVKRVCYAQME